MASVGARAAVPVSDQFEYYDIHGLQADALQRELLEKGPVSTAGHRAQALTRATLRWSLEREPSGSACRANAHDVRLEVRTLLPRWVDRASAPVALRKRWDRLLDTLSRHEAGHRWFAVQAARELDARLAALPAHADCKALLRSGQREAERVLRRLDIENKHYDRITRFGLHQDRAL